MAVADLVTMLLPPFHVRVRHMLHQCGKIAVALRSNDKTILLDAFETIASFPHLAKPMALSR
jgi:hypothetical protein